MEKYQNASKRQNLHNRMQAPDSYRDVAYGKKYQNASKRQDLHNRMQAPDSYRDVAYGKDITAAIEHFAPLAWQESYDNAGWQVGDPEAEATAALLCIDITEAVLDEALALGCNLIISHHPLIFNELKSLTGKSETERCVVKAIRNHIAIYSAHTNLDNAPQGVSAKMAEKIGLQNTAILAPILFDSNRNDNIYIGSGIIGELPQAEDERTFLLRLKEIFQTPSLKHSPLLGKKIKRVALCGGAGSFLIGEAQRQNADIFITGDVKYHDFFKAENRLLIADVGHFESEQFTKELFFDVIQKKFPTFATYFSKEKSNPINYL